jgi:lambda repressor-like predicted transcriptional regulator
MLNSSDHIIHLTLRGRHSQALVRDDEDWAALAAAAERMLFWCGGFIHGCRCEGPEMHFALELAQASIGSTVRHLSGAYAGHLRKRYGWPEGIFKHYIGVALDAELYLDELVIWLHRAPHTSANWTADLAYRTPNSMPWITTSRVQEALGGYGIAAYRRRQVEPMAHDIIAALTRGRSLRSLAAGPLAGRQGPQPSALHPPWLVAVARAVAHHGGVSYNEMTSNSRTQAASTARAIVAVLATRRGASVADVSRLFGRSRSTLIEQAEHFRLTRPQVFDEAARLLAAAHDGEGDRGRAMQVRASASGRRPWQAACRSPP